MKVQTGMRVTVFDHRLYVDDVKTPLSVTMQPGTVVRVYRQKGSDLVDIKFDRDGMVSKGHYADGVKLL